MFSGQEKDLVKWSFYTCTSSEDDSQEDMLCHDVIKEDTAIFGTFTSLDEKKDKLCTQ